MLKKKEIHAQPGEIFFFIKLAKIMQKMMKNAERHEWEDMACDIGVIKCLLYILSLRPANHALFIRFSPHPVFLCFFFLKILNPLHYVYICKLSPYHQKKKNHFF